MGSLLVLFGVVTPSAIDYVGVPLFAAITIYIVGRHFQKKAKAKAKVPAWEAAMASWERSYYCHRNHIVFDPEAVETD